VHQIPTLGACRDAHSNDYLTCTSFDKISWNGDYNADQSRFLRVVQSVFLQRRKIEVADLYEEPFTSFGLNAVDKLFTESELEELVSLIQRLAA
jgi:type I restriction enzyme R subunit